MRAATSDADDCGELFPKPVPGAKTIAAAIKTANRARIKGFYTSLEQPYLISGR